MNLCRLMWGVVVAGVWLCEPAIAQVRVFMWPSGQALEVPVAEPTQLFMNAGDSAAVDVWIDDAGGSQTLNSYQLILRWTLAAQPGSPGVVQYLDDGVLGGGSVALDESDSNYVFFGAETTPPVFHETAPPPTGSAGFGLFAGHADLQNSTVVVGSRLLGSFEITASAAACGVHRLSFVTAGLAPAGGTTFTASGGLTPYTVDQTFDLDVVIGAGTAAFLDDCNLNDVLDGCDLVAGSSVDADADGIPDECVTAIAGGDWTDDIWGLDDAENPPYPDDFTGHPDRHVTIDGVDILVDQTVQVDSLRIINGGVVRAVLLSPGIDDPDGDLLVEQRLVVSSGTLWTEHDRLVACAGNIDLMAGARFERQPGGSAGSTTARLRGQRVTLHEGPTPATVLLQDGMVLESTGTMVLDGTNAYPPNGDCTPPDLCVESQAQVVAETLRILVAARIDYTSVTAARLTRGFDNRSIAPELFNWTHGGMVFDGSAAPIGGPLAHTFEVAGFDLGPVPDGLWGNFAMAELDITAGSHVTFSNGEVNRTGAGPFSEALYVDHLIVRDGATVTLHDSNVYYNTLTLEPAATIDPFSSGELIPICDLAPCCDPDGNGIRDDGCAWCSCTATACVSLPVQFGDVGGLFGACPPDGFANVHDTNHIVRCFQELSTCIEDNLDVGGPFGDCALDAFCNVHDVIHVLSAFASTSTCQCGGPAPETPGTPSVVGKATLELAARPAVSTGVPRVEVDVRLRDCTADLAGYELHVASTGGHRGRLNLVDLQIRSHTKPFGPAPTIEAIHVPGGSLFAALTDPAGLPVGPDAVLATAIFEATPDAAGEFVIDLRRAIDVQALTTLVGPWQQQIAVTHVTPAVVTLGPAQRATRRGESERASGGSPALQGTKPEARSPRQTRNHKH